ncbi:MAG: aminotransferase class V-fold PLP-dependent enzyme [Clostridium sp.]
MINFAVGPVQMEEEIRQIGAEEIPYFRTPEFSACMKDNEEQMCRFMKAEEGARAVFLTTSGTGAMEAAVINLFTPQDKLLVVNGGSFGERFAKICRIHEISYTEIHLEPGKKLKAEALKPFENQGYTGFLVNVHETSTGVLYDMDLIGEFCKRNQLYLVADAISSFLADEFDMEAWGVDLVLTGSQKALALPPGIAVLVINKRAVKRIETMNPHSMYFDLKEYLKDGERGQTPYTPAVSILLQMNRRLNRIAEIGLEEERERCAALAEDFRNRIKDLPLEITSESLSNAVTPIHPTGMNKDGQPVSVSEIVRVLKNEYDIFVCPNGGELGKRIFRVGHIGNLTIEDNQQLAEAFRALQQRGLL